MDYIIKKYIDIVRPNFIINMMEYDLQNIHQINKNDIYTITIDNPIKLLDQPKLKRKAWDSLKLLRNEIKNVRSN